MKKFIFIALFALISKEGFAQILEAKSINQLIDAVKKEDFRFKERGMVFGFNSIQSCLYISGNFAILKNYCYPVRNYPARGYTVISEEFGIIDFYEEKIPGFVKREIVITQFSELLKPYLSYPFPQSSLITLSQVIEKMYYKNLPACWSTNLGGNTNTNDVNCNINMNDVLRSNEWGQETQLVINDIKSWSGLMEKIETSIKAKEINSR